MQDFEKELDNVMLSYIDSVALQIFKKAESSITSKEAWNDLKDTYSEYVDFENSEIQAYQASIETEQNENLKILQEGYAKNATVRKLIYQKLIELIDNKNGKSDDSM